MNDQTIIELFDRGLGRDRNFRKPADSALYVVVCRARDGELYVPERNATRMRIAETVEDISHGEIERVERVYTFDPVNHWSDDASEEVAMAIVDRAEFPQDFARSRVPGLVDFLESHLGIVEMWKSSALSPDFSGAA